MRSLRSSSEVDGRHVVHVKVGTVCVDARIVVVAAQNSGVGVSTDIGILPSGVRSE